jgi:hypothetical protein
MIYRSTLNSVNDRNVCEHLLSFVALLGIQGIGFFFYRFLEN